MFKFSATTRISVGLVAILSSLLLMASLGGIIPNHRRHDSFVNAAFVVFVSIGHKYIMNQVRMVDHNDRDWPEVKTAYITILALFEEKGQWVTIEIVKAAYQKLTLWARQIRSR